MAKSISIPITGNAAPLRKTLDNTSKRMSKFGSSVSASFAKIGKAAAIGGAAAAAGALALGKAAFSAAEAASTSNARLEQIATSMGLFGDQANAVTERLIALANEQARLTGVNQNTIKESQALLLTFSELAESADEAGGAFDRATQLTLDMAAAGFGSATDNAKQLGKALQDPIKGISALARSGVTFTEQQKELIESLVESGDMLAAQDLILTEIENQVGGTAAATANASDRIKVAFSQVTEQIGLALLPIFEKLTGFVLDTVVPGIQKLVDVFEEDGLLGVLKVLGGWIVDGAQLAIEELGKWADKVVEWITGDGYNILKENFGKWTQLTWDWITEDAIPKLSEWIDGLANWIRDTGRPAMNDAFDQFQDSLTNWILGAEADEDTKAAAGGFVSAFGNLLKEAFLTNLDFNKNVLSGFLDTMIAIGGRVATELGADPDLVLAFVNNWFDIISKSLSDAFQKVVDTFEIAQTYIDNFFDKAKVLGTALIDGIVRGIKDGASKIGDALTSTLSGAFGGGIFNLFDPLGLLPGRAAGGNVTRSRPYVVGENGPELFMPHTSGRIVPNHALGGAGGINVTVNMPAGSDGEDVVRAIQKYARRNGAVPVPVSGNIRG